MASNFKIQNLPSLLSVQVSQFPPKPSFSSFNFISRSIILPQFRASIPFNRLHCLSSSSSSSSPVSGSENSSIEHPFEVSYLMNTLGWPPELAISKAKFLKFKSPDKPERVLAFFKNYGFTETQISHIVKAYPKLLVYNPKKTLLPKFEFLSSLGLSTTEIIVAVTQSPYFLTRSLEKTVKPAFKLLRSLVDSDDEAIKMAIQRPSRLMEDEDYSNKHRFEVSYLINTFGWPPEMAISKAKFVKFKSPEKPEKMLEFFKKYGFTETQISLIIKKRPELLLSNLEETILPKFEFLRSLGLSTTDITQVLTKQPKILTRSLENTVKPAFKLLRSSVSSDDEAVKMVIQRPLRLIDSDVEAIKMVIQRPLRLIEDKDYSNKHRFKVSYLINTFGWPPELAISKAEDLKFKFPEKPERILDFFKKRGFTETQISFIIKKLPWLLGYNPGKLLPKLEFLSSLGLSTAEVTVLLTKEPTILHRSLKNAVKPSFKLLRSLVDSDDEAVKMVKQYPIILTRNYEDEDSVQILLEAGVPRANIVASMTFLLKGRRPTPDGLRRMVEEVKEMGFDPCSMKFIFALKAFKFLGKTSWEDKFQVLKKYGWSDTDILLAFEKDPRYLMVSNDKKERIMDFLVNTMGVEATDVANFPYVFSRSFENRIVPRCLVYKSVLEKGLCKREYRIDTYTSDREPEFVAKFIEPYEKEAPELWDLYRNPFAQNLKNFQLDRDSSTEV